MLSAAKNVLIVSASIGSGHTQAARAIQAELMLQSPGVNVQVVDFMDGSSSYFNTILKEAYLKMIDIVPNMYDYLYRWSQAPLPGSNVKYMLAFIMKKMMLRLLAKYKPDLVVFTHPFPCSAAAYLRRIKQIQVPLAVVITDFSLHGLWIYDEIDCYFVASERLKLQLVEQGICGQSIYVTGIPTAAVFRQRSNNLAYKAELGLDGRPVLLIMGGGLGLGAMKEAIYHLNAVSRPLQMIVVTGHNTSLEKSLKAMAWQSGHSVKVLGYARNIKELMAVANLLITKPGGLTCSEAIVMELPLLLMDALPGQEQDNAAYLTQEGLALQLKDCTQMSTVVTRLLSQQHQLAAIKTKMREVRRPDAAIKIAHTVAYYLPGKPTQHSFAPTI
ncbi:MAG TPA: glycosyltransferase [Negativicutes bacterium]|jgi:processive 1,2-diacylglycerol beta-glucosyltransferase